MNPENPSEPSPDEANELHKLQTDPDADPDLRELAGEAEASLREMEEDLEQIDSEIRDLEKTEEELRRDSLM
jgi:hypothetical protein